MSTVNFSLFGPTIGVSRDDVDCQSYQVIQSDPDMAGLGIVIRFVGTAWIVVSILVVYSIAFYDPTIDPFSGNPNYKLIRPNPFDMLFYKLKLWLFRPLDAAGEKFETVAEFRRRLNSRAGRDIFIEVAMAFSDAQLVTGIAIMVSSFYSSTRGMSGYHWKMICRIAWFSTITHLAALSCLRSYLHQNQVMRGIRLFLMGCLAIMLIYATLATADSEFDSNRPASCVLDVPHSKTHFKNLDAFFSVLLMIYNILLRIGKIHRRLSEAWQSRMKHLFARVANWPLQAILALLLSGGSLYRLRLAAYMMIVQFSVAVLVVVQTYYMMYTSMAAEIYWLLISASWGTLDLFELREEISQGENSWTFGQVVSCALFLAPLLAFLDTIPKIWQGAGHLNSPVDPDNSSPLANRYPCVSGTSSRTATIEPNTFELGGLDGFTWSAPEIGLLKPLRIMESRSFSILSAQPLLAYAQETPGQPFLGFFEDLPYFPYLVTQICVWFVFLTFWIFFADFKLFAVLYGGFKPGDDLVDNLSFPGFPPRLWHLDVKLGYYQLRSPALYISDMLPWTLLFAPTYSAIYLLAYPRRALVNIPSSRYSRILTPLRVFLNLLLPTGLILLAMWSWIRCSLELSLLMWAGVVGLYLLFVLVHQTLLPSYDTSAI